MGDGRRKRAAKPENEIKRQKVRAIPDPQSWFTTSPR
jgi:hypothetical protein